MLGAGQRVLSDYGQYEASLRLNLRGRYFPVVELGIGEADADDVTDELIDRFGDPPPGVNALVQVALLRGEATRAGISDISQKAGFLNFTLAEFDFERVSALYGREEYKGRIKVEAGSKPCVSLKLKSKRRTLEEARAFVSAWEETAENEEK